MSVLNLTNIEARDLPDAWFQTLFTILEEGRVFKIDRGSYAGQKRLEFDWVTIKINYPNARPLIPQIEPHFGIPNPVADGYIDEYIPYLMTGKLEKGEAYTYGQRLTRYKISYHMPKALMHLWKGILLDEIEELKERKIIFYDEEFEAYCLNQIELLIWTYKNKGYRNNQMVLQVAHPNDMLLQDPPCLRYIDTRIQNGKLHFFPYFRSWDLWNGLPANLAAIQLLKEYTAAGIGVEDGEIIATSKGLHIYDYVFDLAKVLRMKEDLELKGGDNNG